jgi:predicted HTH transcriptional regulator
MKLKCSWCKKEFYRQKGLVREKHNFCSKDCFSKWLKSYIWNKKLKMAKVLKGKEMTTAEFAKAARISRNYALIVLKELVEKGVVEKYWFGQWFWKLKK